MAYHKYFTLSFDDGLEQDKKLILLMKKYGLKGTFNLNAGMFGEKNWVGRIGKFGLTEFSEPGRHGLFKTNDHFRIPKDEIRQVYEGFEVASHGYRHEMLAKISPEALEDSISNDVRELSELVGYPVSGHAYPSGSVSNQVEECLRRHNILYAREAFENKSFKFPVNSLRYRPTCWFTEAKTMDLLDKFLMAKAEDEDLLFCMMGHGYEMDFGMNKCSWEYIEKLFDRIAGQEDIIYCTNKDAFIGHD